MSKQTETYEVAEGTTVLDGKRVSPGDPVEMTPAQALYHLGVGRLKRASSAKSRRKAPAKESGAATDVTSAGEAD